MELDDTQKQTVAQWAKEGCTLGELQKRINDEFNMSLTFMDVRFLVLDLGIELKDAKTELPAEDIDLSKAPPTGEMQPDASKGTQDGRVSVEIDKLKQPGALVNGTVTFSDGVTASWVLDHEGRLGLSGVQSGYQPSENDLQSFQKELSRLIQSRGF